MLGATSDQMAPVSGGRCGGWLHAGESVEFAAVEHATLPVGEDDSAIVQYHHAAGVQARIRSAWTGRSRPPSHNVHCIQLIPHVRSSQESGRLACETTAYPRPLAGNARGQEHDSRMARMYPATITASTTSSAEERLFHEFRSQLPNDWIVMHGVTWLNRRRTKDFREKPTSSSSIPNAESWYWRSRAVASKASGTTTPGAPRTGSATSI